MGFSEAVTASCQFGSPHRKEVRFLGCGIDMKSLDVRCPGGHSHVRIEGQYTKKSSIYIDQLAMFLAKHIADGIAKKVVEDAEQPCISGLESVILNDLLSGPGWQVVSKWEWKEPCHINVFESRSYVELLKHLLLEGGDCRFVALLDSRVAKGAHTKGRSSAYTLAASLQRACCFQVAGNLHSAFGFAPTRLNTADAPARDSPLPSSSTHSVLSCLDAPQVSQVHSRQFSKAAAGWIRLFILASTFLRPADAWPLDGCEVFQAHAPWISSVAVTLCCGLLSLWIFRRLPTSLLGLVWISSFCSALCHGRTPQYGIPGSSFLDSAVAAMGCPLCRLDQMSAKEQRGGRV